MEASEQMIPDGFRYREVFLRGKPHHERFDDFDAKHPKMSRGKRAKIFAPYDALKGFSEAVAAKDIIYVDPVELEQQDSEELNRRLNILHGLTGNGRVAKRNRVTVTVTYYVPCEDPESFSYGSKGQYKTVTGICWGVDPDILKTINIDSRQISLYNILRIESADIRFDFKDGAAMKPGQEQILKGKKV